MNFVAGASYAAISLISQAVRMPEEGTTCLREAATAKAGEIVQLQ